MRVLVWITEGTWVGCVDAARRYAPADADFVLVHVTPEEIAEAAHAAFTGLFGRGHPRERDPATVLSGDAEAAADQLLAVAAERLGAPAEVRRLAGRIERVVVAAADGFDLLVCARDGEDHRLGPRSLGPATRFVVDHAPCAVVLVWPGGAPALDSIPPPPPNGPEPHKKPPPHKRPPPGPPHGPPPHGPPPHERR